MNVDRSSVRAAASLAMDYLGAGWWHETRSRSGLTRAPADNGSPATLLRVEHQVGSPAARARSPWPGAELLGLWAADDIADLVGRRLPGPPPLRRALPHGPGRGTDARPLAEAATELGLANPGDEGHFLWNILFDPREIFDLLDTVGLSEAQ